MDTRTLYADGSPPFFAEVPYYLWGAVNYKSYGNCRRPTDRAWTNLKLEHRKSREKVELFREESGLWDIRGEGRVVARVAMLMLHRCKITPDSRLVAAAGEWDHVTAVARADLVRREFEQPVLVPFDSGFFWGSWKWIGGFATDCAWAGRLIMHALVRNDPRAIPLCIGWLKVVRFPEQAEALCYALATISGQSARDASGWIRWYDGAWWSSGAKRQFPMPDLDAWNIEIDAEMSSLKLEM